MTMFMIMTVIYIPFAQIVLSYDVDDVHRQNIMQNENFSITQAKRKYAIDDVHAQIVDVYYEYSNEKFEMVRYYEFRILGNYVGTHGKELQFWTIIIGVVTNEVAPGSIGINDFVIISLTTYFSADHWEITSMRESYPTYSLGILYFIIPIIYLSYFRKKVRNIKRSGDSGKTKKDFIKVFNVWWIHYFSGIFLLERWLDVRIRNSYDPILIGIVILIFCLSASFIINRRTNKRYFPDSENRNNYREAINISDDYRIGILSLFMFILILVGLEIWIFQTKMDRSAMIWFSILIFCNLIFLISVIIYIFIKGKNHNIEE